MLKHSIKLTALAAATSLLLSACGGSSSGGGSTPFTPKSVQGVAVDFYVGGATVSFDDCDGVTAETDADGKFNYTTTQACNESALTVTGGTDLVTGLPFTGTLKVKKTKLQDLGSSTVLVASPLTTLEYYVSSAQELNTILANLGITNINASNLSTFDPVSSGTAQEMASIFVLQQLITQIEDSLQALPNSEGNAALSLEEATALAINAVIETLKTPNQPLFDSTGTISPTQLSAVLEAAVNTANEKLEEKGAEIQVPEQLAVQVQGNIQTLSDLVATVLTTGESANDLVNAIENNEGLLEQIQDIVKTPLINSFSLASYSLEQIKNSTAAAPLLVNRTDINNTARITFAMANTTTNVNESAEVGFKVVANRNALEETLDVYLDKLNIVFNTDGSIQSATIPAGATFKIASSLGSITNGTFEAASDISIASNGSISLYDMVQQNSTLATYYNQYFNLLRAEDKITVTTVVAPRMYVIDPELGLNSGSVTVANTSLNGFALTGHFKLN
ncbi:hypothetical protein [Acinetobacter sp. LH3_13]|uniref:hypothetical protein n=1 Tax=Acinetobacter sp. LH3_13 TaxID=3434463 RepID=UPI003EBA68B5